MNCRGCRQRFLPLPDLSRKIEGDSVRRVAVKMQGTVFIFRICAVAVAFNCFPGNGEGK